MIKKKLCFVYLIIIIIMQIKSQKFINNINNSNINTNTTTNIAKKQQQCPHKMICGSEIIPNIGIKKQKIIQAGGDDMAIAIAMLEDKEMSTNYNDRDARKKNDSANMSIYKLNWGMIRVALPKYRKFNAVDYRIGQKELASIGKGTKALMECRKYFGTKMFLTYHRLGYRGHGDDASPYINAIFWITKQIQKNPKSRTNDLRFWVYVKPIDIDKHNNQTYEFLK